MPSDGRHRPTTGRPTFGSLFREPYQTYLSWLYGKLKQQEGFDDVRVTHSTVLRRITLDGVRITDLAERAGMTKQSMAYLVDDLTALGYVALAPDPTDGRAKLVVPTKKGESLLEAARRLGELYEQHVAKLIGVSDARKLRALLEELNQKLAASPPP
jgi:DNA-binding MarR family transcriptional regulator